MATADQFIAQAAKYIGHYGDYNQFNYWYWVKLNGYDYDPGWAWCAVFQSYVADDLGMDVRYSASSAGFATQFERVWTPQRGDFVLFNWDGRSDQGWTDHIGVVEWSDPSSGYFGTIEGNTGNGDVARCTRSMYSSYYVAFYRPDYDGESPAPAPEPPSGDGIKYRVSLDPFGEVWLDWMIDGYDTGGSTDDFAGVANIPIRWLAIEGAQYRVFTEASGWLPWVTACNIYDLEYGCAGDGSPILGIEIANDGIRYAVNAMGVGRYSDLIGQYDTGGSGDTYAGDLVNRIDKVWMRAA